MKRFRVYRHDGYATLKKVDDYIVRISPKRYRRKAIKKSGYDSICDASQAITDYGFENDQQFVIIDFSTRKIVKIIPECEA